MPLQGASLIALYPGRCPGLRASAPSGRAAYMGFCPFRACCLYGLLPLQGIAAYMGFCPFRALQLIWAAWTSGRCCYGFLGIAAYMGCLDFRAMLLWFFWRCCLYGLLGLQGDAVMGFWALLLIWAFGPSGRCCPMQISQNFPSCMVEITLHALLYG